MNTNTTQLETAWENLGHAEYALWQAMRIEQRREGDRTLTELHADVRELGHRIARELAKTSGE